jgi:multidrug efflux pump subunit AcrB
MNIAKYTIEHKVVSLISTFLIVIGGLLAYQKVGRLEDPEFTIKEAVIFTSYPGATAKEVEEEITEPIETAVQQLKQLKEVRSISRSGQSIVFVEVQEYYDKNSLPQIWDELRRKINDMKKHLPPGCNSPVVNDDFGDVYGVLFAITGHGYSKRALKETAEDLRKELLLCTDVGRIDFWGLPSEVIYVEIDRSKLAHLGFPPNVIFEAIKQQNAVTSAGKVKVSSEHIDLRVTGDFTDVKDLGELLIKGSSNGRMVYLKDIAKIKRDYLDPPADLLFYNGQPAVGIGISTISGGNVIAMGDSIKKRLAQLKKRIPVGIELHPIAHQSEAVSIAVQGFVWNLIAAVVIVIMLLVIFMGMREGFIIGAILLITIWGTLICMQIWGIALQRISLGALVIALGMLVDNAIVVVEGIILKSHSGMTRNQAAEETVKETQWPLLGATAIAILAFAAISLSKNMTGEWLASLFQVICLSLGLSWMLAITLTPCLCVTFLPATVKIQKSPYGNWFYHSYRAFIKKCIDHRWISLAVVACLLVSAMWSFKFVKQDFMPDMNRPQFTVDVWLPEGVHIEETAAEINTIGKYIKKLPGITNVASFIGHGSLRFLLTYSPEMPNCAYGQLLVGVDDFRKIPDVIPNIMSYLAKNHPNAVTSVDSFKLGPGGGAVEARFSGPDSNILRELAMQAKIIMQAEKGTRSVRVDWGNKVKVESVLVAEARARKIGVPRPEIANSLAMNFSGLVAGFYREKDDLLPIILRPPCHQRCGIDNLNSIQVWSSAVKQWIPVEQVINGVKVKWENPVIRRTNRMRTIAVFCKPTSGTTEALFQKLSKKIEKIKIPDGYKLTWGGEHKEALEANQKLMSNVPIAFTGMFIILVLLFNSLKHPVVILLGLPLIIVGVAAGLLIANKPFGFMAMLGFLSLTGMLIKNEIVLLDEINLQLTNGKTPYLAVLDSAVNRVRPVSMAAFTTVLGMIPLLWDAFFAPMAVTIMGGLTFATILTLIVVPVVYSTIFRVHKI